MYLCEEGKDWPRSKTTDPERKRPLAKCLEFHARSLAFVFSMGGGGRLAKKRRIATPETGSSAQDLSTLPMGV